MNEIAQFLASSPVFQDISPELIEESAPLFQREHYAAGAVILKQGGWSDAMYFLVSGQLAARIQRGEKRETIAFLHPPDTFGELSFVTGRPCVCDVEVVVDADVLVLAKQALGRLPKQRDAILGSLMRVVAGRLQETVIRGARAPELPVALVRNHPNWEAPQSFAWELARSLGRQTGRETLLVNMGEVEDREIRSFDTHSSFVALPARAGDSELRSRIAQQLTTWRRSFENVILNLIGHEVAALSETTKEFVNFQGDCIGPGDPLPPETRWGRFAVQSAVQPTLPKLSGRQQLIYEAGEAEAAFREGKPVPRRFLRTVDSMARGLAGLQVGLALGGGAAWGWAHVGVLEVFEQACVPIDAISGCSMGSVIGALRCAGHTTEQLREIAAYWRTRTARFIEWRFWRMSLINDKRIRKAFRQYFGDLQVNQTEIPYWANAVDIKTGKEFTVQSGSLVDCIRGAISLPGLIPPFQRNIHLLVDAGIMNPVPVKLVRQMGCRMAIGINAMAQLEQQEMKLRYPFNAFDIMTRCMFVMGHEIGQARAEQEGSVVFTPSLGNISMLQFSRSGEIIDCGRRAAEKNLPAIMKSYEQLKKHYAEPSSQAAQAS